MATKVKFNDLIKSMSGTISRKRLPDGSVRSLVVRKDGTMYETTYYPPKKVSVAVAARRVKFGMVCKAYAIIQKEKSLCSDPDSRKLIHQALNDIYDLMHKQKKVISPEKLAANYAYLYW